MKTFKVITTLLTSCVILMVAFAIVGCEDEPSSDGLNAGGDNVPSLADGSSDGGLAGGVKIVPENPVVTHIGQQIEFEAQGGHGPYTWTVSDGARGSIAVAQNDEHGDKFTAVYTVSEVAVNTIVATDANGRTGVKELGGSATFVVFPSSMNFGTNGVAVNALVDLKVQGGVPPYVWSTDSPDMLNLAPTGETCRVTFVAPLPGAGDTFNVGVYCVDQSEQVVTSAIKGE